MLFQILSLVSFTAAHGLLYSPINSCKATVRGIQKLNTQIDALRSPIMNDQQCRGEPKAKAVAISLGAKHTVTLAISKAALHIGDCFVYLLDENMQNSVQIAHSTDKIACALPSGTTADEFKCDPVPNSITNDMCLIKWTFKVENVTRVKCKNCILQWKWTAKHLTPYENFENCADIKLVN